jgi:hypothetical protein
MIGWLPSEDDARATLANKKMACYCVMLSRSRREQPANH